MHFLTAWYDKKEIYWDEVSCYVENDAMPLVRES